jgi:plasmid stabilization system protein ParE
MKVQWTQTAIGHLASIYEYISRDSARFAQRMVDRITSRSRHLARFPMSGQMVAEYTRIRTSVKSSKGNTA